MASALGLHTTQLGSARRRLVDAGIVFAPAYGRVQFTLPLFDRYLLRLLGDR